MASIALLLQNRKTWIIPMIFGGASVTILAITGVTVMLKLHAAEQKIKTAKDAYVAASKAGDDAREDERLLKEITGEPLSKLGVRKPA